MVLEINDSKTVQDMQQEFSNRFPYLKLEFFYAPHMREEPSNDTPCSPANTIGEIRKRHVQGIIEITPDRETGSIEQEFESRFDLHVQIYRLQADQWIQTVGTDILTLEQQNEIAKDSAAYYNPNHELTEEDL